ncbi:MAG: Smr/MutS family protein [Myxococcota bacterium]
MSKRGFNQPFRGLKVELPKHRPPPKKTPPAAEPQSEPDEATLFADAMADVHPMDGREAKLQGAPASRRVVIRRSEDEEAVAELEALVNGDQIFEMHESEEFLSGVAPGVNHQLLGQLRRGEHSYRRHIDLHGHSKDEAKATLAKFISDSRRSGERCVLVVTGRGRKSPGGVSVLRESLPRWLTRHPNRAHVLAFCTAKPVDGGPGAFYVLLRRPGVKPYGN